MSRELLTGNGAAAWGARLASVDYIPAFPITPQTEIIESLSTWIDNGEMPARLVTLESEHSMMTAAGAAAATGVRVFTATSSQGLLYALEMLYTVSGWRVPLVLINVSRGLSAPITLEPDHNDILAARDSGFLQIHCASCQEVLDSVLLAYRLSEHAEVMLPVIVNLDGFYLSFTREPVDLPDAEAARQFVGAPPESKSRFRASMPTSQAVAVLGGSQYSYFRYQTQLAALNALSVYDGIAAEFRQTFNRDHPSIECYHLDDAEYAFLITNCYATKAREAVDQLRAAGWKIGMIRPRLIRPFPEQRLRDICRHLAGIAVIDQNLSFGKGGILHTEVASALYGMNPAPLLAAFVGGLGGRDISQEEFFSIAEKLRSQVAAGVSEPSRMLYTREEYEDIVRLQTIAMVERHNLE